MTKVKKKYCAVNKWICDFTEKPLTFKHLIKIFLTFGFKIIYFSLSSIMKNVQIFNKRLISM